MNKVEFIKMMRQDIETHKDKELLENVVVAMEEILSVVGDVDIDTKETPETLFEKIKAEAKKLNGQGMLFSVNENNIAIVLGWIGVDYKQKQAVKASKLDMDIDDLL